MTPEQFCYWLQGFFEMTGDKAKLSPEQVKMVRDHLAIVFKKVTPPLKTVRPSRWDGKLC